MTRWLAFAPLIALVVFAIAAAGVLTKDRGARETISAEGLVGEAAPAFALAPLHGDAPVTPAAYAGRAYVVNFFASTCAPCLDEHPLLMAMRRAGAPVLGVAYKDPAEQARLYLERHGDPFDQVGLDPEGRFGLELGVAGIPETFVIGADGRILALYRGVLTEEIVRDRIMPALRAR